MSFCDLVQGHETAAAGVGDENVELATLCGDARIDAVQVSGTGHIAFEDRNILAAGGADSTAGDEYAGALLREQRRRGKTDSFGAAGHQRHPAAQVFRDHNIS